MVLLIWVTGIFAI